MSSGDEIQMILKVGWWEKEISRGYLSIMKYRPRFLILTNTHLKYYHQSPLEASSSVQAAKEIPLSNINEQSLLEHAVTEPDILHVEFSLEGKKNRFRLANVEEVAQWRNLIVSSKSKSSHARVHFGDLPAKPLSTDAPAPSKVEMKTMVEKDVSDWLFVYEQVKEDVVDLELATCSSTERAKFTANCFFESLQSIASKDRGLLAKEMGKAMLGWLDTDYDSVINSDDNNLVAAGSRPCTKLDVFMVWLRIALSREYLASCKFDESGGANDDGDLSSESSSNMTHSTIKSRMRKARMGSIIMPFRADTPECLFISSIIHSASFKHRILHQLLHAMLRPVALMPESFVYPRPIAMSGPAIATMPFEVGSAGRSMAEEKMTSNTLSRRSRRFLGGFVRNVLRLNSSLQGNQNGGNGSSDPPILEVGGRVSSLRIDPSEASNAIRHASNDDGTAPPPLLTPIELQRIEIRKRLLDLMIIFSQRFEESATTPNFPKSISTIVSTIRDLIIVTRPENIVVPRPQDLGGDSRLLEEEKEIMYRNRMRFEYGTFFTSCSALLFLRLICRAIISPEDYGVLEKTLSCDDLTSPVRPEEGSEDPRLTRSRKCFAPMVILAHVIRKEIKRTEAMETGSSDSANGGSGVRTSRRHRTTDYSAELHAGSSSSLTTNILSLSDDLSSKAPRAAATKCLDYLQNQRFSFHDWMITSQAKATGISVPTPVPVTTVPPNVAHDGDDLGGLDDDEYSLDMTKPNTRWALAEVAKTMQHIANISCLPTEEMFSFARESLIRQNIQAGLQDRDSYDTHQLTSYEEETINVQLQIAGKIKEGYERLADLPSGNW